MLDYAERRIEPFEKFTKSVVCPNCGRPDPAELYFDVRNTGGHLKSRQDIVGCDKCIKVEYDLDEIYEFLKEED